MGPGPLLLVNNPIGQILAQTWRRAADACQLTRSACRSGCATLVELHPVSLLLPCQINVSFFVVFRGAGDKAGAFDKEQSQNVQHQLKTPSSLLHIQN